MREPEERRTGAKASDRGAAKEVGPPYAFRSLHLHSYLCRCTARSAHDAFCVCLREPVVSSAC